ncbi:MAG: GTPase Era [Steroidobacteraceae bacterium]
MSEAAELENPAFRAGFVALLGRPNVGKSTLLNALAGSKLSIVTPHAQTTRHRISAIIERPGGQIILVDTPGVHRGERRALNKAMNRTASGASADADMIAMVVEAGKWQAEDDLVLSRIARDARPVIAVINKIDRLRSRDSLLPYIDELSRRHEFAAIVPVSASKADNLDALVQVIERHLPQSSRLFPQGQRTDRSIEFRAAEVIREKLSLELRQELPFGIAVQIEGVQPVEEQLHVDAVIWVDRPGHKPIVIGQGGERLKRIGRNARLELNELYGQRVHLTLWVKIRPGWADDIQALRKLEIE